MLSTMLRFFLIVFISFLPKIAAEPNDNGNIFFESPLRSDEVRRPKVRSINDESSNTIDEEDSDTNTSSFHFNYQNTDEWGQHYPDCNGKRQSPIDFDPFKMDILEPPVDLETKGYETTPSNMTLVNNGHTVQLSGIWDNDDQVPNISFSDRDGEYAFLELHFHWGSNDNTGSEHTIQKKRWPLEMQMVHYKKDYGSPSEAMKHEDGLVIIAIIGEINESENNGILALQKYAEAIKKPNSQVQISPFPLIEFQKLRLDTYMTYKGSVTTPPCSEIVTWIVTFDNLTTNQAQIDFFRSIELSNGDDHNYRPTMPRADYEAYCKFPYD